MSVTFDTLKYAETLKKAGFDEKQAAAQSHALKEAFTEDVASKDDLKNLETGVKGEISTLRAEIKGEMASLRIELQYIKWGIGAILVGIIGVFSKLVFFMN